jgi:hypothetical protein
MCQKLLDELKSESFVLSAGFLSTPRAVRRFLSQAKEIRELREALRKGSIAEETIREFVSSLMAGFRVGQRFEHELALAGLAVVLERRPTEFAEEFLHDLATLRLAEMPLSIRVARECLTQRTTMTRNKGRDFRPPAWARFVFQPIKVGWRGPRTKVPIVGRTIPLRRTHAEA